MAQISAALVKQLREQTGAGMMDCKKALGETGGDIDEATDWLRKKGLAAAAKKAGRAASDGLIGMAARERFGALVELNTETDFVARNEQFQKLASEIATLALEAKGDREALLAMTMASGRTVADEITETIAVIGENMTLRRTACVEVEEGVIGGYVHAQSAPGLGSLGVLVGLHSKAADRDKLAEYGKHIAMHIAAANPQATTQDRIDPELVRRERAIFEDQAKASGKPDNIVEKMVEGRLRKFYEESVLLEQNYVIDTDKKVKAVLEEMGQELGAPVEITEFVTFRLGEGVEKAETDLASEVAQLAGG